MRNIFRPSYRELSPEEQGLCASIKDKAIELYGEIEKTKDSREKSLSKTKLEEAVMWAIKGLTT